MMSVRFAGQVVDCPSIISYSSQRDSDICKVALGQASVMSLDNCTVNAAA